MSDPMIIAGAMVLVIGAFVTGTVTILKAIADNRQKTETVIEKSDEIIKKADEIHVLTNSNLTKVNNDLTAALTEIKALKRLMNIKSRRKV